MEKRCEWCGDDPLYLAYHDEEWGGCPLMTTDIFSKCWCWKARRRG